jgi:hypothetical protein
MASQSTSANGRISPVRCVQPRHWSIGEWMANGMTSQRLENVTTADSVPEEKSFSGRDLHLKCRPLWAMRESTSR